MLTGASQRSWVRGPQRKTAGSGVGGGELEGAGREGPCGKAGLGLLELTRKSHFHKKSGF